MHTSSELYYSTEMKKPTLNIIGCGNVAKTLAHLWNKAGVVEIGCVLNQSQQSADASVSFIGAGRALSSLDKCDRADYYLVGCGDDQLADCLQQLDETKLVKTGDTVFHCSGSKPSSMIKSYQFDGVYSASLHPIKSFANPQDAITSFKSTYCGFEGDETAVTVLKDWVEAIGGVPFDIDPEKKLTYHAASVFACNYMVALQELSISAFAQSGVDRGLAMKILEPIVKGTADNIFKLGTAKALTGPIARGDYQVVSDQLDAVSDWDKSAAEIYKELGLVASDLSEKKGVSSVDNLERIRQLLSKKTD